MKIDNRKVNGQVNLEPTDLITGFNIRIAGNNAPVWTEWNFERKEPENIDPSIVAARIRNLKNAYPENMLRFCITRVSESGTARLCPASYKQGFRNDIVIDIGEIMPEKHLTISLTTGEITLA